jgi:hypothetical protein
VLNALFLKVEPWYLDAQKDSMAVMPEMYLGDTMWPYALLDKEMARWSPPKEELEDIKATANMLVFSGFKILSETPESDGQASVTFSYVAALANPVML